MGRNIWLPNCCRALFVSALLAGVVFAQTDEIPLFRSSTQLVLTGLHVVSGTKYVTGLHANDFQLLVDGKPREITSFEEGGLLNAPLEIVLVFDSSGSVRNLGLLDERLFRDNLLSGLPNVALSLYRFGGHPNADKLTRVCGPTNDPAALRRAFESVVKRAAGEAAIDLGHPGKDSLIYESITEAIKDRASDPQPSARLMLVASDGLPGVEPKPGLAINAALEMGIPIYPLVMGHHARIADFNLKQMLPPDPAENPKIADARAQYRHKTFEEQERQAGLFAGLASKTGGRAFDPTDLTPQAARDIIAFLAAEVRTGYIAGFAPEPTVRPTNHKIEIRLTGLHAGQRMIGGIRFATF